MGSDASCTTCPQRLSGTSFRIASRNSYQSSQSSFSDLWSSGHEALICRSRNGDCGVRENFALKQRKDALMVGRSHVLSRSSVGKTDIAASPNFVE